MSDMKQNLLLLCAAAVVLAACTKDEPTDGTRLPEGQYPLEIARITLGLSSVPADMPSASHEYKDFQSA